MGHKNDEGFRKKIVLKAKPQLPAAAKPDPDPVYDLEKLGSLSRAELIDFVASECRKHNVASQGDLLSNPSLKPLAGVAKLAGILDAVFRETETRDEKSPLGTDKSTVRPPPRMPPEPPPVSIRAGREPVSAVDDTVAVQSDQQPAPSRLPPAPKSLPPPQRLDLIDLDAEAKKILDDKRFNTRQTYEKFNELMLLAARKAVELHKLEVDSIKGFFGGDMKKLNAALVKAKSLFESGSKLPGPESRLIELAQTQKVLEAILKSPEPEPAINDFIQYLNAKIGLGMKKGRIEAYVDKIREFREAVLKKEKEANGEDKLRGIRSSRHPSPKNGMKPPEKTPKSAIPDEPAFVQNEEGKRISSVPPERKSEPPASSNTGKEPGRIKRFFTNPMTLTLGGIAGFTSALVYKNSFEEMSRGLRMVLNDKLHLTDFEFTKMHMYLGYSGLMLFILGTTELLRRRAVKKKAKLYAEFAEYSKEEREREKRIIAKLTEITLKHDKWEDQLNQLRIALLQDSGFMEDLYEMKKHRLFNEILADARIHPKLVQNLNLIFDRVKSAKLEKRLAKLAEVLLDPKERNGMLAKFYQEDPIFRRIIDELFEDNGAGSYVNMDRQNQAFAMVLDHNDQNVGKELQKALQNDYVALKSA